MNRSNRSTTARFIGRQYTMVPFNYRFADFTSAEKVTSALSPGCDGENAGRGRSESGLVCIFRKIFIRAVDSDR